MEIVHEKTIMMMICGREVEPGWHQSLGCLLLPMWKESDADRCVMIKIWKVD